MSTTKANPHAHALEVMTHRGIVYPAETLTAQEHNPNVPLSAICAFLMLETSGGHNVFGHDPTIFVGAGTVTRAKYRAYVAQRDRTGKCQGVGPGQLTSKWLQDLADKRGGCHVPVHNISVAAWYLGTLHKASGSWQLAFQHYNGSGPAAVAYGKRGAALMHVFHWEFDR